MFAVAAKHPLSHLPQELLKQNFYSLVIFEAACDFAALVENQDGGKAINVEVILPDGGLMVDRVIGKVSAHFAQESQDAAVIFRLVHTQRQTYQAFFRISLVHLNQMRKFHFARPSELAPDVQKHHLSFVGPQHLKEFLGVDFFELDLG